MSGRRSPGAQRSAAPLGALVLVALGALALPARAADVSAIRAETLQGAPFRLDSLRGKVVVLDFWAPWCLPCRKSFPFLDALDARYRDRGLAVVGLTLEERREAVDRFLDDVKVGFRILRDPTGRAGEALGVAAMPTTFLLDREGRVAARFEGGDERVHERLEEAVKALLDGKAVPPGSDVLAAAGTRATGGVKAWSRGYLADPMMELAGDRLTRVIKEHVHASKEAAAGDGGASGGGCGCN
ncbi:MAG: DUF4266 domain-containing protein [Acidobacteria bacterium]|nr:MAG: DUF4266 domain-containing protein [Acidobacteriota bacterium]